MRTLTIAAVAALAVGVAAECPNACSGNGECGLQDQCMCYDNFIGADCSQRQCPFALAFVDVPNGDLNHDGMTGVSSYSKVSYSRYYQPEYWPSNAGTIMYDTATISSPDYKGVDPARTMSLGWKASANEAHWYAECSGKGACDRSSGECGCFDGYTGSACQRTTCPNDCSGHGRCKTVSEIAKGALNKKFVDSYAGSNYYSGVQEAFDYRAWDGDKNQACVCDSGYGGHDCSLRECPRGDDPLTNVAATCNGKCANEVQAFLLQNSAANHGTKYQVNFRDFNDNMYTSPEFKLDTTSAAADRDMNNAAAVEAAFEGFPNMLLGNVTVATKSVGLTNLLFTVQFDSLSGNVPEVSITRAAATGLDAVSQPFQPIQKLDVTGLSAINNRLILTPADITGFHADQLKSADVTGYTAANIATALASIPGLKYELGSAPANVVLNDEGLKTFAYIIFADNANRPGASKKMGSLPLRLVDSTGAPVASSWSVGKDGNTEYSICSNRGMCDFSSGLCACFTGYTGYACQVQSALAF